MWGRKRESKPEAPEPAPPGSLREALRTARVDAAERTGVVVDLHDAELARIELLNEALDPVFAEIPPDNELFDRGISRGETPRLWIDAIAHVAMGKDKRVYRFVQDTRYGRKVLAEAQQIPEMVQAVTRYIASRLIERERALSGNAAPVMQDLRGEVAFDRKRRRRRAVRAFVFGLLVGFGALFAFLWLVAMRRHGF